MLLKGAIMLKEKTHALTVGTKYQKAKQHVQDNRNSYLAGAGGLAVGALGVLLLTRSPLQINNTVAPVISPVFTNVVNNGGYMRKIVRCIETDEMWPSVSKSAEAAGVSIAKMSQHLNDHKGHVNNLHYVIEGLAAG
jgi:hypothetical protein